MWHNFYTSLFARGGRQETGRGAGPGPQVESLEDRVVPTVGADQLQATQVVSAIAISTETAFEANYKVLSQTNSVSDIANLISAFLHAEQNALTVALSVPGQSPLTQAVLQQSLGYVTQEVDTLEPWYKNATAASESSDTILTELDALAQSFQGVEQTATAAQTKELRTGTTIANTDTAFTYIPPQFISPGGGGVATPTTTPSIIDPSFIISEMNNNQINSYISVANSPVVTSDPTSVSTTVAAGTATFTATASGAPTPTVQWQFSTDHGNTYNIVTNGLGVAGATTNTLSLSGVAAGANGYLFRAVFTNASGSATSAPATLSVTAATMPAVTLNPTTQSANVGDTVALSAAATGSPTPTVQWQVKPPAGAFTNLTDGAGVSGSATPTLTLSNIDASLSGNQYQAIFTNGSGTATTMPATLTVV